jgi:hypothetical protein
VLRPHAVEPGLPFKLELTLARPPADKDEAQELEGFRFAESVLRSVGRRMAAKLDQAGLVRMQRQRELLQPFAHRFPEAPSVGLVLEADDESTPRRRRDSFDQSAGAVRSLLSALSERDREYCGTYGRHPRLCFDLEQTIETKRHAM